jgi:type IV pilus assembly protein PilO
MVILDKINEMNTQTRAALLAILVALPAVVFYMYLYSPNVKTIARLTGELSTVQTDLQGLRAIAAKLPEFKKNTEDLQAQLLDIRKKLPLGKEIPKLLDDISRAGQESGLRFELFRPQGEVKREFYSEVPVDVAVRGPFHNVVMFMDRVTHFNRIVNVTNFSFSSPKEEGSYVFIMGSGLITTYRYEEKN